MDPEACLREAESLLEEYYFLSALDEIKRYWRWRKGGGFEPRNGDERARHVERVAR